MNKSRGDFIAFLYRELTENESEDLVNKYNLKNIYQPDKKLFIYFESVDTEQNARLFLTSAYKSKSAVFKFLWNKEIFDIYVDFVVDKQIKIIKWNLKIYLSEKNVKETDFLISLIKNAFTAHSIYQSLFNEINIIYN
ncbi:MAG: hypothetical protein NC244_03375 [Alistipes senegalensis]|nr:hypothetical protein [Alistipes senegalensis]